MFFLPKIFGGLDPRANLSSSGPYSSIVNGSSIVKTFNLDLAPHPLRRVFAIIHTLYNEGQTANAGASAVTIGGITASKVVESVIGVFDGFATNYTYTAEIWAATVPTGTTAEINATLHFSTGNAIRFMHCAEATLSNFTAVGTTNDNGQGTSAVLSLARPGNAVVVGALSANSTILLTLNDPETTQKYHEGINEGASLSVMSFIAQNVPGGSSGTLDISIASTQYWAACCAVYDGG